jgi:hypothetical protein
VFNPFSYCHFTNSLHLAALCTPQNWILPLALVVITVESVPLFLQNQESDYLSAFPSLVASSYQVPLPSAALSCQHGTKVTTVNIVTLPSSNSVITGTEAQAICGTDSICVVPSSVTLNVDTSVIFGALRIYGTLQWDEVTLKGVQSDSVLCAGYVAVESGGNFRLSISQGKAMIYIMNNGLVHDDLRSRGFGSIDGGKIHITGRPLQRTWSLLGDRVEIGSSYITLLHNPKDMGWQVGDRIVIAPTTTSSRGTAEQFVIGSFEGTNRINLLKVDGASTGSFTQAMRASASFVQSAWTAQLQAEVINLSRNVVITGDDFEHIPCDASSTLGANHVCQCDPSINRSKCTVGLHVVAMGAGSVLHISHTRIEKCGQRGIKGKYCLHLHLISECPNCVLQGNAVEYGHQRGIVIHQTHLATVADNTINDVRGAGIYIEDGNEMNNRILYNVIVCPWPYESAKGGCSIPGTDNDQADTSLNQSGIWALSFANYLIGNRAANSFNGMLYQAQGFEGGRGDVSGLLCTSNSAIGRLEGNTFQVSW